MLVAGPIRTAHLHSAPHIILSSVVYTSHFFNLPHCCINPEPSISLFSSIPKFERRKKWWWFSIIILSARSWFPFLPSFFFSFCGAIIIIITPGRRHSRKGILGNLRSKPAPAKENARLEMVPAMTSSSSAPVLLVLLLLIPLAR